MRAAHIGHEVVVFHVLSRDEVELPFRDDVELEDPETGRLVLSNGAAAGAAVPRSDQRVPRAVAHALRDLRDRLRPRASPTRRSKPALRAYLRRRAAGGVS